MSDENARSAAHASSDIRILGCIISLLESNNLSTPEAKRVSDKMIVQMQRAQQSILRKHDATMRSIGI
ncbi:hypothetical protein [Tanticharoenia sakaeratensis]|uniref:hypothetical protein n=1 Tax=Tanticharoenia sakaeratensis TaxID=444053 RepID=UPI0006626685|nr:hypothetical protein [Tanticharoenia sakaeratensis]